MKRKGPGRPSKLTPEVEDKLLTALRAGNFRGPSAFYAGVSMRALQEWMAAGKRDPKSDFGRLRALVLQAEKGAEIAHVANIAKAAREGDWKAAAWWLERKASARWARPQPKPDARDGTGQPAVQVVVQKYEAEGTPP